MEQLSSLLSAILQHQHLEQALRYDHNDIFARVVAAKHTNTKLNASLSPVVIPHLCRRMALGERRNYLVRTKNIEVICQAEETIRSR